MLHEILLSLSGHPSALFTSQDSDHTTRVTDFPLLSPPEYALLASIGQLSRLHRDLRAHTTSISNSNPSTICRAVATAITTVHLARFQQKILDVEAGILKKDAASVGAYNIVPLAGVVGEFDEWTRLMEWYWKLVCFIHPMKDSNSLACSGSGLIDRLRQEAQTGYPDIEDAALGLAKVAETAWLRQLSTWVLYGRLPAFGAEDFFIRQVDGNFEMDPTLRPKVVTPDTASSMLFIGKSLNHIRARGITDGRKTGSELDLLPIHLKYLSELALPLSSASLSTSISTIRLSLSRNTLQQLLPLPKIIELLTLFREFFLLGKGEFAVSLITEADTHLQTRNRAPGVTTSKPQDTLRGLAIKEVELTNILSKTFSALSSYVDDDSEDRESLDLARSLFHLSSAKSTSKITKRASNPAGPPSFNDFLLPLPTELTLELPSPLDLFATSTELIIYSNLHSYLLSIRRAHMRLGDLWRQTLLRRCHPTPLGPPLSCSDHGQKLLEIRRRRALKRNLEMRSVWATCSAAVFLLSEMGSYFEGEVVGGSCSSLREWILPAGSINDDASRETRTADTHHDPETLSSAHRTFLSTLTRGLLMNDTPFTQHLRTLLQHIDALVALLHRLQSIQSNLDLEEDDGVILDALSNTQADYQDVSREIDRARKRVDSELKALVGRLRELDQERDGERDLVGAAKGKSAGFEASGVVGDGEYEGWKGGGGVERLLMRLDVRYGAEGGSDEDDER